MEYQAFLTRIIDDGLAEVADAYADEPDKLKGCQEGFEACRGKTPAELRKLLEEANKRSIEAHVAMAENYWETRYYNLQVEWVCNCVSAAFWNQGLPTIIHPTARGASKAAEVLGTA